MLSEFANVFDRKVSRVQIAHLHNAARALSTASLHRLQVRQRLVDARLRWLRWLSNSHTWHASRETLNVYSLKYRTHQVGVRL